MAKYEIDGCLCCSQSTESRAFGEAPGLDSGAFRSSCSVIRIFTGSFYYFLAGVLFALFVMVAGLLANLQKGVERAIGQTLFRERYDAYDTLVQFSKSLVSILELSL